MSTLLMLQINNGRRARNKILFMAWSSQAGRQAGRRTDKRWQGTNVKRNSGWISGICICFTMLCLFSLDLVKCISQLFRVVTHHPTAFHHIFLPGFYQYRLCNLMDFFTSVDTSSYPLWQDQKKVVWLGIDAWTGATSNRFFRCSSSARNTV